MNRHQFGTASISIGAVATHRGTVRTTTAIGRQLPGPAAARQLPRRHADIGILTVLTEELRAVVTVLQAHRNYRAEQLPDGPRIHRAEVDAEGGVLRVVAMQTLEPGAHSATTAYHRLRDWFRPPIILLVGVAGGIRADLAVGDVVIADEVIYYDDRRETSSTARRRGRSHSVTPVLRHRINDFFLLYGRAIRLRPAGHVRVFRGPIGTGGAVITDEGSDVIDFLRRFNEKTLAVETEAAGVGQAFYEEIDSEGALVGWLTIRGISDLADREKGHDRHQLAADHAAAVMDLLLPLLGMPQGRPDRGDDYGLADLAEPA